MRLRIAHVTATFPPYLAGTGNVCFHNARELARCGHEVHVFTSSMPSAAAYEERAGIVIHRLRPVFRVGNAPALPGLLRALRGFDIMHLHFPFIFGAEIARLASTIYGIPLVVSFHNDLIGDGSRARLFSLYQQLSTQLTVRYASRLCVVSLDHYQASRLHRSLAGWESNVVELPNGVDAQRFHPGATSHGLRQRYCIPAAARLVLFVAALDRAHHFKGLGTLLQAMLGLPPDVWLLIVGDGDLRPTYQQQAICLGVGDRTIFAGTIEHDDTPAFFRDADVTVLPSLPPESFGLVLIESLACGTPVIASNIPGVRTVVDHNVDGCLVEPNSPTDLAAAIRQVLQDDAARQAMGQRGRTKVEARYGWEQIGLRLEAVYHQVLGRAEVRPHAPARGVS